MKVSEFWRTMESHFGAGYARVVASQTVLDQAGNRTAEEALDAGLEPRLVWKAVCLQHGLPESQWLGVDPGSPSSET